MRRLVEYVQHLLPCVQDKVVRTRAEGILQQVLPPEQKRAAPGQTIKRKRGAIDMGSTGGLWTSKRLKDGNLYVEKKEGESDKEYDHIKFSRFEFDCLFSRCISQPHRAKRSV